MNLDNIKFQSVMGGTILPYAIGPLRVHKPLPMSIIAEDASGNTLYFRMLADYFTGTADAVSAHMTNNIKKSYCNMLGSITSPQEFTEDLIKHQEAMLRYPTINGPFDGDRIYDNLVEKVLCSLPDALVREGGKYKLARTPEAARAFANKLLEWAYDQEKAQK